MIYFVKIHVTLKNEKCKEAHKRPRNVVVTFTTVLRTESNSDSTCFPLRLIYRCVDAGTDVRVSTLFGRANERY